MDKLTIQSIHNHNPKDRNSKILLKRQVSPNFLESNVSKWNVENPPNYRKLLGCKFLTIHSQFGFIRIIRTKVISNDALIFSFICEIHIEKM